MAIVDVVCVGSVTSDTIALVAAVPGDDERVLADEIVTAGGGPAGTAAVALARLGARVGLCAVIGDDDRGSLLRAELEREGVVLDWLSVVPGATTTCSCVLVSAQTGGRTIIAQRAREPRSADVPVGVSTWIHVDQTGIGPVRRALAQRPAPILLSVDGGNPLDLPDLTGVELYVPSVAALLDRYPDAPSLSAALDLALADGATWVVATDGPRGAHVRSAAVDVHVPAYALPVVSTLGAGDVFHGALLAAIVGGATVPDAARAASAAAALSCRAVDGRSAIPNRAEMEALLHEYRTPEERVHEETGRRADEAGDAPGIETRRAADRVGRVRHGGSRPA